VTDEEDGNMQKGRVLITLFLDNGKNMGLYRDH
jgi:hypothetical protein